MKGADLIAGIPKLEGTEHIPTFAHSDIIEVATGVARHTGPNGLPGYRALARVFIQTGLRSL